MKYFKNTILIICKIFIQSKSLVWCPVYKAASTNWMHNLLHLGGKSEKEVEEIIKKYPK